MSILSELQQIPGILTSLVQAIQQLRAAIVSNPCGCPVGEGADNAGGDGTTIPGQTIGGIEFQEAVIVDQGRCDRADYIYRSVNDSLVWWATYNVVGLTGGTLSAIIGFYSLFLVATGPFGVILTGVAGLLVAIALAIVTVSLDLDSIVSVWQGLEEDIICCLYNATDTDTARQCVDDLLTASVLDSGEVGFVLMFLPNGVLSLLFADTDESVIFFDTYEAIFDCSVCVEPLATEWMLMPADTWSGFTDGHPELGTGTVMNDGTQFTVSSVSFVTGAQTLHAIGLIVKGFYDSQTTPSGLTTVANDVFGGTITRVTACPSNPSGLQRAKPNCAQVDSPAGPLCSGAPQTVNDRVVLIIWRGSSFTVDFTIDTLPTVC